MPLPVGLSVGIGNVFICILISDYSIYLVETRTRQDVYPIASWGRREVGGLPGNPSPTSNSNDTRFPEENQVKSLRCSKYQTHQMTCMIYLNRLGNSVLAVPAIRDSCNCCRTTHNGLRMPKYIVANRKKVPHFLYAFMADSVLVDEV